MTIGAISHVTIMLCVSVRVRDSIFVFCKEKRERLNV